MSSPPPEVSPAPPFPFSMKTSTASPPSQATPVVSIPPGNGAPQAGVEVGANKTTLIAVGVGIGIGGAIVLVCVGIFVFLYKRRKRKLRLTGGEVVDPFGFPPGQKGDAFGGQHHYRQQSVPPGSLSDYPSSAIGSNSHPPASAGSSLGSEKPNSQHSSELSVVIAKNTFTYAELASVTCNFASTNLLGEGGFGYVHKGVLPDGKEVAIKQLKAGSLQGEREFQAEVGTISRVNHRHLVSLEGYCCSGSQRLLVYEYVPNKTLEFHLHGKGQPALNWATRMKIALGSATGLAYLHDECRPKIIHRDIKAANILLDHKFEAKVADFGLARFYADADTHVSTRVMGTFGYLAPEYALSGKLTDKSDVFSFGVVLLELITGRRPIDKEEHYLDDNIVDWARPLLAQALDEGNFDSVADTRLQKDYDPVEMARMVACASVCVRHLARLRPKMNQIVLALEGKISAGDLYKGVRPGESAIFDSHESTDYNKSQYKEDLKKFRKMALEPLENNSSECSGPTSDFGVQLSASSSEGLGNTQEHVAQTRNQKGSQGETEEKHG